MKETNIEEKTGSDTIESTSDSTVSETDTTGYES